MKWLELHKKLGKVGYFSPYALLGLIAIVSGTIISEWKN